VIAVVCDTNVYISAVVFGGSPLDVLRLAELGRIQFSSFVVVRRTMIYSYPKLKAFWSGNSNGSGGKSGVSVDPYGM